MKKGIDHIGVTVSFFCHDGKGNYLFALRSENCRDEHNCWDNGGGSIEFGDSIEKTLKKEILEEYCTEVLDFEFLGYRDVHREHEGQPTHWISLDFRVLVDPTMVKIGEPQKFNALAWYKLNDLPENLHSQFLFALEKFKDKLI